MRAKRTHFEVRLEGTVVGRLVPSGPEQPWSFCRFEPAEAFAAISHLFEAQARHIAAEALEELDATQERIWALGLIIVSVPDGMIFDAESLIIDGDSAEFVPIRLESRSDSLHDR